MFNKDKIFFKNMYVESKYKYRKTMHTILIASEIKKMIFHKEKIK